jgi:hypothetical protein
LPIAGEVSVVTVDSAVFALGVLLAIVDAAGVVTLGVLLAIVDGPGVTVAVVVPVGNLLSRVAIRSRRTLICWLRLSYRLLRVPSVAAARANVIIPNRPIIPNAINTRIFADPSPAINTYLIEKSNSRFC